LEVGDGVSGMRVGHWGMHVGIVEGWSFDLVADVGPEDNFGKLKGENRQVSV